MNRPAVSSVRWWVAGLASLAVVGTAAADRPKPAQKQPAAPAEDEGGPPEKTPFDGIKLEKGPLDGKLEQLGTVKVPEGYLFASGSVEAGKFMEATNNPASNKEVGVLVPMDFSFFVLFEFSSDGYVKDDDKDKIDADAILKNMREGQEAANSARKARGWNELTIEGWHTPPRYNQQTHNLEWGTIVAAPTSKTVNYNVRLLGRRGIMEVTLLAGPDTINEQLPKLRSIIDGFAYKQDESYAAYKPGDKVATYGLVALAGGGVLAAAAKGGLFNFVGKFIKLIVVGVAAVGAAIAGAVKRLFGGKQDQA